MGKRIRLEERGDRVVHQVDRTLGGRQQQQQKGQGQAAEDGVGGHQGSQDQADQHDGDDLNAANVEVIRVCSQTMPQTVDEPRPIANPRRKQGKAAVDQVVADMRAASAQARVFYPVLFLRFQRQRKRRLRHFQFRSNRSSGQSPPPACDRARGCRSP